MPIPDSFRPSVPEKKEYELLPDDIYQVQITKIDLKENVPVYQSTEVEDRLAFEFMVVEEGQYKGRKLWQDVRTVMSAGSTGYSPSWLYKLFCAVNRINLSEDEAKGVAATDINDMVGKGLRLVVKQEGNRKGVLKNKIKDVLPLKGLATAANVKVDAMPEEVPPPDEPFVDPGDIPF